MNDSPSRQDLLTAYNNQPYDISDLQHNQLELEAKNEHLTNLLVGLNDKLHVFNDFKQDVANHKVMLKSSEQERENW